MTITDVSLVFGNLYVAVFIVGFIGAITPGPDILLILRNTISFGAKPAFIALGGIICGWLVYLGCVYFGFAHIMSTPIAQGLLSVFGALYLGYISYKILRAPAMSNSEFAQILGANTQAKPAGFFQALGVNLSNALYLGYISYKILRAPAMSNSEFAQILGANTQAKPAGFFQALGVNLSNPKAILFFVVVVAPFAGSGFELGLFVLFCSLVSGFVGVILVGLYVRKWLNARVFLWIDRISAVLFIVFACSLFYRGVDIFLQL